MSLSVAAVYRAARAAGLGHGAAVTATAIAIAESGLNPDAVGDTTLANAKWGPSVGLWQIRTLNAEKHTGGSRDAAQLRDPASNARSMVEISNKGASWTPWSVYTSGAYKSHLGAVESAVGPGGSIASPTPTRGDTSGTLSVLDWDPFPGGGGIPGYGDDFLGKLFPDSSLGESIQEYVLLGAGVALGVSLIAIGAWRAAA